MSIQELIALSVAKLVDALDADTYTAEELNEAIQLERDGQNRSTAIEAIEDALKDVEAVDKLEAAGLVVAKGKSITSLVGIRDAGEEVTAEMLVHGDKSLEQLHKAGFLVEAE